MTTLAATDYLTIWLFGAQMVFNVLVGLVMFWLKRKSDQTDNLKAKIASRDEIIHEQTERMVDEKIEQKFGLLVDAVSRIEKRLSEGDRRFEQINSQDHQAELARLNEVHELRQWVTTHCATKTGVADLSKQLMALRDDVIRIQSTKGAV